MIFRRTVALALAAAATTLLAACGDAGPDPTKVQLRLVNASGYEQLDLRVHGALRQGAIGYGSSPGYVEVEPDEADTQITVAGSSTPLLSFTPGVAEKRHYSVLAYGDQGALRQVTLDEDTAAPDTNKTLLRVLNGAPDAGALDVYLTDATDPLPPAVAVQANAAYDKLGPWITVDSRSWRLRVTAAGSKTDVRLDVSNLVLSSKQVATLVLTSARGGVLVNGVLVTQQGDVGRADTSYARVRAVAGVASSASVGVRLADVQLMEGQASPAVASGYTLVPAGSPALVVTVEGAVLPAKTPEIRAGTDYTVLVHGTPAQPLSDVIEDDNHLPTDGSQARIRLVNGVSGLTVPLSLTVDLSPVGVGVDAGRTSGYGTVPATAAAEIAVTGGTVGTVFRELDRALLAGATYSVFVLGARGDVATAPTQVRGVLRKDR